MIKSIGHLHKFFGSSCFTHRPNSTKETVPYQAMDQQSILNNKKFDSHILEVNSPLRTFLEVWLRWSFQFLLHKTHSKPHTLFPNTAVFCNQTGARRACYVACYVACYMTCYIASFRRSRTNESVYTECFAKRRGWLIQWQSEFWHTFRGTFCKIKFILLQKPIVSQLVKKFLAFYETRRLFLASKTALQWTPSKLNSIQTFTFVSLKSFQTVSCHPPQNGFLPSGYATRLCVHFLHSYVPLTSFTFIH
jgi:hypothetical protein